jgi:hypothetical protein
VCYIDGDDFHVSASVSPSGIPTPSIMKNTLLVVTDLAGFKAYRLDNGRPQRSPRLELLEEFSLAEAHERLVDQVSDLSGRFPRSTGGPNLTGAMSDGERHNIEREQRKRLVRQLAQRLSALLLKTAVERCYLAASREINHQLIEELDPRVRGAIAQNLPADLTKIDKAELLRHFESAPAPGPADARALA